MAGIKGQQQKKPSERTARTKVWQSMRILRIFTYPQLQMTTGVNLENIKKITATLVKAGYVFRVKSHTGKPGEHSVFRLKKDTGPLVPICGKQCLYDPNIKRDVPYVCQTGFNRNEMLAVIEAAKMQLNLSEEAFEEIIKKPIIDFNREINQIQFEALIERFRADDFQLPDWFSKRLREEDKNPLIAKLKQVFSDLGLSWDEADCFAYSMVGVKILRWCDPIQLRGIIRNFSQVLGDRDNDRR